MPHFQQFHVDIGGKYICPFHHAQEVPETLICKGCGADIYEHRPEPLLCEHNAFNKIKCERCGRLVNKIVMYKTFVNAPLGRYIVVCEEC